MHVVSHTTQFAENEERWFRREILLANGKTNVTWEIQAKTGIRVPTVAEASAMEEAYAAFMGTRRDVVPALNADDRATIVTALNGARAALNVIEREVL